MMPALIQGLFDLGLQCPLVRTLFWVNKVFSLDLNHDLSHANQSESSKHMQTVKALHTCIFALPDLGRHCWLTVPLYTVIAQIRHCFLNQKSTGIFSSPKAQDELL